MRRGNTRWAAGRLRDSHYLAMWAVPILILIFLVPIVASAGGGSRHLEVFSSASVNVFVMPFEVPPELGEDIQANAPKLQRLVQMEVLLSLLGTGGIGVMRYLGDEKDEKVAIDAILGNRSGAVTTVREGNGLVFVWGRFYQEDDSIFVQTYVRFVRRGVDESISTRLTGIPGGEVTGTLPNQTVTFAPRLLSVDDLNAIDDEITHGNLLRVAPRQRAAGVKLEMAPLQLEKFSIVARKGKWLNVLMYPSGRDGWIKSSYQLGGQSLRETMPELFYIEALVCYLQCRIANEEGRGVAGDTPQRVADSFESYMDASGEGRNQDAAATSASLLGILAHDGWLPGEEDESVAIARFEDAVSLKPYAVDLRNLLAVAQLEQAREDGDLERATEQVAVDLVAAVAVEPANPDLLSNLEAVLGSLAERWRGYKSPQYAEISAKLEIVEEAQAVLQE
jgi:hypothetical protein